MNNSCVTKYQITHLLLMSHDVMYQSMYSIGTDWYKMMLCINQRIQLVPTGTREPKALKFNYLE